MVPGLGYEPAEGQGTISHLSDFSDGNWNRTTAENSNNNNSDIPTTNDTRVRADSKWVMTTFIRHTVVEKRTE